MIQPTSTKLSAESNANPPSLLASSFSRTQHHLSTGFAAPKAFVLHNSSLVPGDLRDFANEIGGGLLHTISIKYCYAEHFHRKKVHEPKLLAELLDILHEARCHGELVSIQLQGPFPRHAADVKRLLTELTAPTPLSSTTTAQSAKAACNTRKSTTSLRELVLQVPEDARIPISSQWVQLTKAYERLERLQLEAFDLSDYHAVRGGSVDRHQSLKSYPNMNSTSPVMSAASSSSSSSSWSMLNLVHALKHAPRLRELVLKGCRIHDK